MKCVFQNFFNAFRNSYFFYPSITKTLRLDLLLFAALHKDYALQVFAPEEGVHPNLLHTSGDFNTFGFTAPEPVISDSFCALWDNYPFTVSEVPDPSISYHRLWWWANFRGVWYLKAREICFTTVHHVDLLKISTVSKSPIVEHAQRRRERDLL